MRIVKPWRTRAQNALTFVDSSAKATSTPIASAVRKNSVKRGCDAKNARSNAGSFEKSGGFGKTPCVNANASTSRFTPQSNTSPVQIAAMIAG